MLKVYCHSAANINLIHRSSLVTFIHIHCCDSDPPMCPYRGIKILMGKSFQRDTEAVLSKKLNETTEELRRESHKAQTIRQEMEKMKQASGKAEQELAALQQKMQSLEAARAQDMDNLTAVQNKLKVSVWLWQHDIIIFHLSIFHKLHQSVPCSV